MMTRVCFMKAAMRVNPARNIFLLVVVLVQLFQVITSEIVPLSLVLYADSSVVHFVKGYIAAPGYIDIEKLKFIPADLPPFIHDDFVENDDTPLGDDMVSNNDDVANGVTPAPTDTGKTQAPTNGSQMSNSTESPTPAPTGVASGSEGGGGNRTRYLQGSEDDDSHEEDRGSIVDIAVFRLPDSCANSINGCDWADLGIGTHDNDVEGDISYCCSEDTVSRGVCDQKQLGRLIVDKRNFVGETRLLPIPSRGDETQALLQGHRFEQNYDGAYVLVLANCNDNGREILVLGSMEWMSSHGFLPGDMLGLLFYYVILVVVYLVLFITYVVMMRMYQDSYIPIQKYIMITIALGLIETSCLALELVVMNETGTEPMTIAYTAIFFGVFKRSLFRCLGVMVCMGWGVVRDSLGITLAKILFLGSMYGGLTTARDVFTLVAVEEVQSISTYAEDELIDVVAVLTIAIIWVNLVFYCWMINSLAATTEYLRNMSQTSKLRRHLRLRCIIWISLIYGVGWLAFTVVDTMISVLDPKWDWILEGSMHANYVFVLVSVAILWKPNPNAKEYAMQMELPALSGDADEDGFVGNELELTPTVPSAADDDDGNDPDHPDGIRVDDAVMS